MLPTDYYIPPLRASLFAMGMPGRGKREASLEDFFVWNFSGLQT